MRRWLSAREQGRGGGQPGAQTTDRGRPRGDPHLSRPPARGAHRHPRDDGGLALDELVHLPDSLLRALVFESLLGELLQRLLELLERDGPAGLAPAGSGVSGGAQGPRDTRDPRLPCRAQSEPAPPPPQPAVFAPSSWLPLATAANMNCLAEKLKESTSFMKDWTSKHSLVWFSSRRACGLRGRRTRRERGWEAGRPPQCGGGLPGCKEAPSPEDRIGGRLPMSQPDQGPGSSSPRRHSPWLPGPGRSFSQLQDDSELALHL